MNKLKFICFSILFGAVIHSGFGVFQALETLQKFSSDGIPGLNLLRPAWEKVVLEKKVPMDVVQRVPLKQYDVNISKQLSNYYRVL